MVRVDSCDFSVERKAPPPIGASKTMKPLSFAAVFLALVALPHESDAAFVSRSDANVSFKASGTAGMNIVGTTRDLVVSEDGRGSISVTVTLGTLTTGIGLRDKHMREKYLQVQTYPTAVLRVSRAALKVPGNGENGTFDAAGTLTLHGQTKPVRFRYTAKSNGGKGYRVDGSMSLDMADYGIEKPSYLGIGVKTAVDLSVSFTADDK